MPLPDIQDAIDLIEQGAPAEAIPLLEAVAERMPTYVAVYVMMARAHEAEQQQEEALAAWEQAAFLMPNSPAICEGLARVRTALQAMQPAIDERLRVDLDLQAELDAALETPFNPFARPPHSETAPEALDLEEERPVTLAEASLALIERALSEAEIEAEETSSQVAASPEAEEEEDTAPEEPTPSPQTLAARRALEAEAAAEESAALSSEADEDLDRLIDELGAARIVPQPDVEDLPPPDLDDDIDDMVSETLARIYASQEQYGEAARIYEQLARQQPDQAERFLAEAAAMRERE
ncbi:MAG TPA: tetratricopeptide repeat protein [Rhodothermales bacterium]|nr:tetratricopeptide repeat protein [Rhodothermales bacterium]